MREEQFYFSSTEYRVMLALSGGQVSGPEYAEVPGEQEIIRAICSLNGRKILRREGDSFVPDGFCGSLFSDMARADRAVFIRSGSAEHPLAMAYSVEGRLVVAEIVPEREDVNYRVFESSLSGYADFLRNADILSDTSVTDADKAEAEASFSDDLSGYAAAYFETREKEGPKNGERLYLRRYRNGTSGVTGEYAVCTDGIFDAVLSEDEAGASTELYTEGSADRMLKRCF